MTCLSQEIRRRLTAVVLLAVILSAGFVFFLSLSEGGLVSGANVYRYSDASVVVPSKQEIQVLLASFGQTMNLSDFGILRQKLASVVQADSGSDLFAQYTSALFDLSGNLSAIQSQVKAARSSLISGNRTQASTLVGELEQRREQTGALLNSLHSLISQIGEQYQIDTTSQVSSLDALGDLYNNYSIEINQLASQVSAQARLIQTILSLNSSASQAFVGQSVRVYGSLLTANGTMLENRIISLSWDSKSIETESAPNGSFEANVTFPAGSLSGPNTITADYEPSGLDKLAFVGSTAQVQLQLFYEPSTITAEIGQTNVRPLDIVDVWGNLSTTSDHIALANRTIMMQLDGVTIGNATTNESGDFFFNFYVPRTISNGTHSVEVVFNATNDLFAPTNSSLPINVQILATQTQILLDHTTLLSGTMLTVNGTVSYLNATYSNQTALPSGNATVYVDNVTYANATLNTQGSFIITAQVPLATTYGAHTIVVQYYPDKPWLQSSQSTASFYVLSVPVLGVAFSIIAIASVLGTYAVRRNRRKASQLREAQVNQPITQEPASLPEEFSRSNLVAEFDAQASNVSKVKTAYGLAQLLIDKGLGIEARDSETPSEFLNRIDKAAPPLTHSLGRLVELFELAEYAPYPMEADDAEEAREKLLELREEMENVKTGEDYKR